VIGQHEIAACAVAGRWSVHDVGVGQADRSQHALEEGEPPKHPRCRGLGVLLGDARPTGAVPVRLERLAAVPLADVEQSGRIVDVLIQSSKPPPGNTAGWK
jgi:hypothetical protein